MKVFILSQDDLDSTNILGVFDSEGAANAAKEHADPDGDHKLKTREFELGELVRDARGRMPYLVFLDDQGAEVRVTKAAWEQVTQFQGPLPGCPVNAAYVRAYDVQGAVREAEQHIEGLSNL